MTIKKEDIIFNIVFWFVYFSYEWLAMATVYSEYQKYLVNAAVIVPITAAASLFTVHILFRKFHLQGRRRAFWIGLIFSMVIFVLIRRSFKYFYTYPKYYPEALETMSFWFLPKLIIVGVNIYLIVGVYTMFYFVKAWYEQQRLAHALQQEKTGAELKLLKSQIQPHFILNTLNNIYSYAVRRNDKAADLIYQLSSFLSYGLYENKESFVPLLREIEVIRSYTELEQVRYGNRLDFSMNLFDNLDQSRITPLLLLPLVENCFKHGSKSSVDHCWIRIDISKTGEWLVVKIENSVSQDTPLEEDTNGGIGLNNVKRRLEIVYPGKHELKIKPEEDTFLVILKIKEDKIQIDG